MAKAKRGRKRNQGERYPGGKLRAAWDYGCEGVKRRRAIYSTPANDAQGAKLKVVADQTFDAIGRAWSAGLLDVNGKDAAAMRDAGRDVAALYWRHYGIGAHRDSLARFYASVGTGERDLEHALNARLDRIKALGSGVRAAFDLLVLGDPGGFDEGPAWLDRLIFARRKGNVESIYDRAILDAALKGLGEIC